MFRAFTQKPHQEPSELQRDVFLGVAMEYEVTKEVLSEKDNKWKYT